VEVRPGHSELVRLPAETLDSTGDPSDAACPPGTPCDQPADPATVDTPEASDPEPPPPTRSDEQAAEIREAMRGVQRRMTACLADGTNARIEVLAVFRGADGGLESVQLDDDAQLPPSARPCLREAMADLRLTPFSPAQLNVRYTIVIGTGYEPPSTGDDGERPPERAIEVRNRGSADLCVVQVRDLRGGIVRENLLSDQDLIAPGENRRFEDPPEGRLEYVTQTCRGHTVQNIRLDVNGPDAWMESDFATASAYPFNVRLGYALGGIMFTATCSGCGTAGAIAPVDVTLEIGALFGGAVGIGLQARVGMAYFFDADAISFVGSLTAGLIELQSSLFLGPGVLLIEDTPYFAIAASGNGIKLTDQLFFLMNFTFGLREETGYWVLVNQLSMGISWTI